jgi:hypothetical protein
MKASDDLVIARDRVIGKTTLTSDTWSSGEDQTLTTQAGRHREGWGDLAVEIMQTLKAVLREIFDESAYDRFLLRTQASRSAASYRAFTCERDAAMVKKPRCC